MIGLVSLLRYTMIHILIQPPLFRTITSIKYNFICVNIATRFNRTCVFSVITSGRTHHIHIIIWKQSGKSMYISILSQQLHSISLSF